jgi:hypothetical protein
MSVAEGCRLMGIARSTYYDKPEFAVDDTGIVEAMIAICDEFEAYGYRRVRAELRHQGIVVNHKKIRRLMREHDLQPRIRRRYVATTDSDHDRPIFPNRTTESLLAGLLFDEAGNRTAPSHANKAGRRYRYYVSKPTSDRSIKSGSGWRLPAPTIETAVLGGIRSFLCDGNRLTKALELPGSSIKDVLIEASRLSDRFLGAGCADQRALLLEMVNRIEVRRDRFRITLCTSALRAMLGCGANEEKQEEYEIKGEANHVIEHMVVFKRRGIELKLVLTDNLAQVSAPDSYLVAAIAKGRYWYTQLRDGEVESVHALADRHGVDQGDVSHMLPLGLLAPDLVEAILAGRQPITLTAKRLKRAYDLPLTWAEQRRVLGFD